ncbi:class I adenylate-forming enzyme family protein [Bradyrhizobium elkanii]|uniref:class I adenylate-forming enzyme family protein n=1 Tax=Bradyrhizobium elkanii TaxID=29448 RepID=UPI001AE87A45|nr:fatty acid--CoA ligase family protein [Bradyrhizobium elkanii]MBP2434208.1 acyl-CoA synthetase (AMP-forming)/AMP-acid ligase II [Bradyrhizobium elkanii]WLA88881.1 fatty acid--CoA ligase family protein [Bradyrhizobium elkanii]
MSDALRRSHIDSLFEGLERRGNAPALVADGVTASCSAVLSEVDAWTRDLSRQGVARGDICGFAGDYNLATVSLMLALIKIGAILTPFSQHVSGERQGLAEIAGTQWAIDPTTRVAVREPSRPAAPDLIGRLRAEGHAGLIVFTSGSSGNPKAILHDVERVASKFSTPRKPWRMLLMLLMDHFGGFNTLLSCLFDGGVGICVGDRSPLSVCQSIEAFRAELLPTTPTFLGLLIGAGIWKNHDLSSLKLITYGAEPMPPSILRRIAEIVPNAELKQTYGLSELGVLRSSSPDAGSLWLRIGGGGFETRVVDGELHIRSSSSMLGYLNAPSPIDESGWMNTGDLVEQQGDLIRFIGRKSEIINVGGQKVFPTEVESVILEVEDILDAVVFGIPHRLLGNAVVAQVAIRPASDPATVVEKARDHCLERLQKYKVPLKFEIVDRESLSSHRSKKVRSRGKTN